MAVDRQLLREAIVEISEFQALIESIYLAKDSSRGIPGTFMWLAEEVGELSRALRRGDRESLEGEFADVLAWTVSLASLAGVDVAAAVTAKYSAGCPKCGSTPCRCSE